MHPTAVIQGPVIVGEGSKILAHATIAGPCVIGKRCIIANNTLVRGSSIGDDSVVGFGSEVKGCVLHSHVWTHMTYLGDSVIGRNVSFGGGCMTGNLRLDEGDVSSMVNDRKTPTGLRKLGAIVGDDCRFGIQCGILPGMKIGTGTFVSAGVTVSQDIPEGRFVILKDGVCTIRENSTEAPFTEDRRRP